MARTRARWPLVIVGVLNMPISKSVRSGFFVVLLIRVPCSDSTQCTKLAVSTAPVAPVRMALSQYMPSWLMIVSERLSFWTVIPSGMTPMMATMANPMMARQRATSTRVNATLAVSPLPERVGEIWLSLMARSPVSPPGCGR